MLLDGRRSRHFTKLQPGCVETLDVNIHAASICSNLTSAPPHGVGFVGFGASQHNVLDTSATLLKAAYSPPHNWDIET